MNSHQVAHTIYIQIGGLRFKTMTGARDFVYLSNGGLQFSLPNPRINKVIITLTPMDTYKVEFLKFNKKTLDIKVVKEINDVYANDLQRLFTEVIGLYTHL